MSGEIYVVKALRTGSGRAYVQAQSMDKDIDPVTFTVAEVIERLLVDEEIELSQADYISAR